jgi:pimeloyl-ACP methyl ester carboxylesterase
MLTRHGLRGVTVIGSSIGGWIAAELAARAALVASSPVSALILIGATGLVTTEVALPDFTTLTPNDLVRLSYHDAERFRIDPASLSDAQRKARAGNREAMGAYMAGQPKGDSTLGSRLASVRVPTLALWGESDGISPPDYGRAFARAIPGARFELLPNTGHLPQLETPEQTLRAILEFVG